MNSFRINQTNFQNKEKNKNEIKLEAQQQQKNLCLDER